VEVEDPESGQILTIDSSSASVRRDFVRVMRETKDRRDSELKAAQVERIDILTDKDIVQPLVRFFSRKHR
jgi:hypothetical protein